MKRFIESFKSKLDGIDFETLEKSKYSIYGLSEDLEIIYLNPAWVDFGKKNGIKEIYLQKPIIGTSILNSFAGQVLKNFYKENFLNVLKTRKPWRHEYECSSIEEFRKFHQKTYPLKNGKGLVVINTLTIEVPMESIDRKALEIIDNRYVNKDGLVTQCSNCRCTQRANELDIWDWVPKWIIDIPENFSHSICPICFDYYWKVK